MYDKNDIIFVVDLNGNVVAKNLDGTLRGKNFADKLLVSSALKGTSNRDIMQILGKTYRVTAAPMKKEGKIVGAYCSADVVNSETAKEVMASLTDEASLNKSMKFYFGFFNKNELLGSTMPTELHEKFRHYINTHKDKIEKVDQEEGKVHQLTISLKGESFYASITRHPSLSDNNDMFYLTLTSLDELLEPVIAKYGTFILITILLLVAGLISAIVIDEQFNKPINKFMENMLEIINGNTDYRFDNDAKGLESNLNQNANMMIATLLGEKVPEKTKEIDEQ
jgi:methyl-accepting chemotaxis protein